MKTIFKRKKIVALIPCYNEEGGIEDVIKSFPAERIDSNGYDFEIVIIDNNSTDRTAEIAKSLGVTVLHEPQKGKGHAIRLGFGYIKDNADYVVMLDGDTTYRPEEILRLIEPLDSGFCNVVVGSRLNGRIIDGSMTRFNRFGNWVYSYLVRFFYGVSVTDVLTGYYAWKREAVENLRSHLKSSGFTIEMEMVTKMARLGENIYSVPITYAKRAGHTNLHPISDGSRILWMFVKNLFWRPDLKKDVALVRKKIAMVSDAVYPFNKGGKEKRIYDISTRLASEGYDVTVYCMRWWPKENGNKIVQNGVVLEAISPLYPLYAGDRRSIKQAVFFALHCFKLMNKDFDTIEVDHIPHIVLFATKIVCLLKRKKMTVTWHEVWGKEYWKEYLGTFGTLAYWIERISSKLPDVIISVSDHTTKNLRDILKVSGQVITINNGLDINGILSNPPAKQGADIIFAGRLLAHKNVDLLLRATDILVRQNPKMSLFVIGDGPEKRKLEILAKELKIDKNVSFLGFLESHEELYRIMRASKVFVLPSTREGFGIAAIEANACGLPVVTIDHVQNATRELIVDGENGILTAPNKDELATAIERSLNSKNDRSVYRKYAERHDWKNIMLKMKEVYGP